jgi:hypothetical protein
MDIIKKDRNHIFFNKNNPIIPDIPLSEDPEHSEDDPEFLEAEKDRVRKRQLQHIVIDNSLII